MEENISKLLLDVSIMRRRGMRCWYLKETQVFSLLTLVGLLLFTFTWFSSNCCLRRWTGVPDVVHFYRGPTDAGNVTGPESLCLRAALSLHAAVHVHSARPRATLSALNALGPWPPSLRVLQAPSPTQVFTGPDANLRAGRLVSLHILKTHGGIYLGNNVYLLRNLDEFRGDEMTISLQRGEVQTQLLIAQKDAKFIQSWLASYIHYRPEEEIMTSLPLDSVRTVKEAVIPVFGDVFFIPDYVNINSALAIQLIL